MKKIALGIMLSLLIIGTVGLIFNVWSIRANSKMIYVDDDNREGPWDGTIEHPYQNITSGLKHASINDAVFVHNGTYCEIIRLNKSVSLIGENKYGAIIDGNFTGSVVVMTADSVNITNFTIRNEEPDGCGVNIEYSKDCIVSNNVIINNLVGIRLWDSRNNTISENQVFCPPDWLGVALYLSNGNTLTNNSISYGYIGLLLSSSDNNTLNSNKPYSNYFGIRFADSNNNTIVANKISDNERGVHIASYSTPGFNNLIYHNNFINNTEQATEHNSTNIWYSSYPSSGNYWSNYNGTDLFCGFHQNKTGSDGIGDTQYVIPYLDNSDRYPLMKPYGIQHDIGITSITTSKTIIVQGYSLHINIRSVNYGVNTENFNVTVYANTTIVATLTNLTLSSGNSTTLILTWDTTDCDYDNYTISTYASPVPGEVDTSDNTLFADKEICVTIPGDVDGDFDVDIYDVVKITGVYWSELGDPEYKPNSDINGDGIIDIYDVIICTSHYGETYP